jgi:hypothetical protein
LDENVMDDEVLERNKFKSADFADYPDEIRATKISWGRRRL